MILAAGNKSAKLLSYLSYSYSPSMSPINFHPKIQFFMQNFITYEGPKENYDEKEQK